MLNSCGHALSQGDGSDFHPGCNWEATSPGYSPCVRTWRSLTSHHRATPAGLTMVAQKSWKNMGMLADVAKCGRSRKWGCRGRLVLGFKPRRGSHAKWGPHGFGVFPFATWLRKQERCCGKERGERTLAGGPGEGITWVWIENWRSRWRHS